MTEADADAQALPYVSSPSEFGSTSRDSSDPSSLSPPSSGSSSSGLPASARLRPPPIPLPLARSTPHSKARSERDGVRAAQCSDGGGVDESDEKGVLSELTVALMARREACERTLSSALDSRKTTGKKRKAEADSSLEHCVRLEQRLHTAQSEPHHFHLPGGRGFLPPTPAFLHLGVRTTDATCDAFTQIYHGLLLEEYALQLLSKHVGEGERERIVAGHEGVASMEDMVHIVKDVERRREREREHKRVKRKVQATKRGEDVVAVKAESSSEYSE